MSVGVCTFSLAAARSLGGASAGGIGGNVFPISQHDSDDIELVSLSNLDPNPNEMLISYQA